jgi:hypothetical protein
MPLLLQRLLVLLVVLGVTELTGLGLGATFGLLLGPASLILVAVGLAAGAPALVVGLARRRAGAAAGGVSDGDLLVHVVLLVNALLLVAALVGRELVPGNAGWSLAACAVGTAAVALLGVPASVLCSWQRAFLPVGHRGRNVVVALSHAVSIWFAVLLLAPTFESFRTALLGSLTT